MVFSLMAVLVICHLWRRRTSSRTWLWVIGFYLHFILKHRYNIIIMHLHPLIFSMQIECKMNEKCCKLRHIHESKKTLVLMLLKSSLSNIYIWRWNTLVICYLLFIKPFLNLGLKANSVMFNVQPSFILLLLVTANSRHEIFYWDCSFMTGKSQMRVLCSLWRNYMVWTISFLALLLTAESWELEE